MEQSLFITALNTSIMHSVILGFIIYTIVHFIMAYASNMKAYQRFNLVYTGVIMLFIGFILSFINAFTNTGVQPIVFDLSTLSQEKTNPTFLSTYFLPITYTGWISLVYVCGLLVQALNMLGSFYRLAKVRNDKQLISYQKWNEQVNYLCKKLNIHTQVGLYLGKSILGPFTAGFIKPVIIFPIAIINRLTEEQVEAILLHELAHIKRNDYLLNIMLKVIETILFFNPFVWMLSKHIREEREFACDDLVIFHTSDPENYSRALLCLAESKHNECAPALAARGNKYELFNRIKRINTMENLNSTSKHPIFALIGIIGVCISIAWAMPADSLKHPKPPQPVAVINPIPPVAPFSTIEKLIPAASAKPIPPMPPIPPVIPALPSNPESSIAIDTNHIDAYFKSADWLKQMAEIKASAAELKRKYDSEEWKAQIARLKNQAEEIKLKFDSPEWKQETEKIRLNAEEIKKKFDSPEWTKQVEELKMNAEEMRKKVESPEWKQQVEEWKRNAEEIKKKFDTPKMK